MFILFKTLPTLSALLIALFCAILVNALIPISAAVPVCSDCTPMALPLHPHVPLIVLSPLKTLLLLRNLRPFLESYSLLPVGDT